MNNEYCPRGCKYLSLTEEDQNKITKGGKESHWCTKYNVKLYHLSAHPDLYRCKECCQERETITMNGSQNLTIININMQDERGNRVPYLQINQTLKAINKSLYQNGMRNFVLIPHYGDLGKLSIVNPTEDGLIYVSLDGDPKQITLDQFKDALNTKLRELSNTEDGITNNFIE